MPFKWPIESLKSKNNKLCTSILAYSSAVCWNGKCNGHFELVQNSRLVEIIELQTFALKYPHARVVWTFLAYVEKSTINLIAYIKLKTLAPKKSWALISTIISFFLCLAWGSFFKRNGNYKTARIIKLVPRLEKSKFLMQKWALYKKNYIPTYSTYLFV